MSAKAAEIASVAIAERALQRAPEFTRLIELVLRRPPSVVVEIGTLHGGTLKAWCMAAADGATIVSVDVPDGEFGGGIHPNRVQHLQTFAERGQRLEFISGDSHAAETREAVANLADDGIDLLFIDGDHTYAGVKADFADYSPLVKPGGLIAFHDIAPYPEVPRCQVERFWRMHIRGKFDICEFYSADGILGCGIGVVEVAA